MSSRFIGIAAAVCGLSTAALAGAGGGGPPVCDAGPISFVECNGSPAAVQLDGTGSFDPDGDPLSYMWTACPGGSFDDPTSPTPVLSMDLGATCSEECGMIRLTVTAGGQSSMCTTAAVVSDTMAPSISGPADVLELWTTGYPGQTDPMDTGMAMAMDACHPNPTVSYMDLSVVSGVPPSGIELVITREFTVSDCAGSNSVQQTITLVGPSFFSDTAALDVLPGDCGNQLDPTEGGMFMATVMGLPGFDITDVDTRTLTLRRTDGVGGIATPARINFNDVGVRSPTGLCHELGQDGVPDLVLRFGRAQVAQVFQLDTMAPEQVVTVVIQGQRRDGTPFEARDILRVPAGN